MNVRRFTRLTNAFSKKAESLRAAVDLHFTLHNVCRKRAAATGIADRPLTVRKLVELTEW